MAPGTSAPDRMLPELGWRVWDVVELDGSLRLCSLAFWTVWLPRRDAVALCRRSLVESGLPPHAAPRARCTCGIYGTRTAAQALAYSRTVPRRPDTLRRVAGRVALWGTVVEAEGGWRASHAYPAELVVPAERRAGRLGRRSGAVSAEAVATGLADYGVPVEVVDAGTERGLARLLEPPRPPA